MYDYFKSPDYLKEVITQTATDECIGMLNNYPKTAKDLRKRLEGCGCSAIRIEEVDRHLEVFCKITLHPSPLNLLKTDVKCDMFFALPLFQCFGFDLPSVWRISVKSPDMERFQPFEELERLYDENDPCAFRIQDYLDMDEPVIYI